MSNLGYCLYGFYQNQEMPLPLMTGIDNVHKLEAISLNNLSAVVSQVPLEEFGEESRLVGANVFHRERLKHGNYIDAMVMLRRDAKQGL